MCRSLYHIAWATNRKATSETSALFLSCFPYTGQGFWNKDTRTNENKVFSSLTISSILPAKCLLSMHCHNNNQPEVLSIYSHYKNIENILLGSPSFITHIQQVIEAVSELNLKGKYRLSPWPWKTHSCLHSLTHEHKLPWPLRTSHTIYTSAFHK